MIKGLRNIFLLEIRIFNTHLPSLYSDHLLCRPMPQNMNFKVRLKNILNLTADGLKISVISVYHLVFKLQSTPTAAASNVPCRSQFFFLYRRAPDSLARRS